MKILGVDPGTIITGYGIIDYESPHFSVLDYGSIKPPQGLKLSDRYLFIYHGIEELIAKFKPEALVVETQFVSKNPQSAIKLGMARGIIVLAAKKQGISVFEYAPKKAKLAVTGNGKSSKFEVQKMVQLLLKLPSIPTPEDAADALSIAICHANSLSHQQLQSSEI